MKQNQKSKDEVEKKRKEIKKNDFFNLPKYIPQGVRPKITKVRVS